MLKNTNLIIILSLLLIISIVNSGLGQYDQYMTELRVGPNSLFTASFQIDNDNLILGNDFSSHNPISGGAAFIRNENGEIRYYTNGCYVYDENHLPIHTESLLSGSSFEKYCNSNGNVLNKNSQFIQADSGSNLFYLIYSSGNVGTHDPLTVTELNAVLLDAETGSIINKSNIIQGERLSHFDICKHKNGKDYWLTVADVAIGEIITFLISNSQFTEHSRIDIPSFAAIKDCKYAVNLQFSSSSDKFLIHFNSCYLAAFDYDACLGVLSNPKVTFSVGSYNDGAEAAFTNDGAYIIVTREEFDENLPFSYGESKALLFETDRIGINAYAAFEIIVPNTFRSGRIIPIGSSGLIIFNRFGDSRFIFIEIDKNAFPPVRSLIKKAPFVYSGGFSKPTVINSGNNNCISSSSKEMNIVDNIIAYPNPVANDLFLDFSKLSNEIKINFDAHINDIQGKLKIQAQILNTFEKINVEFLPAGMYVLTLQNKNGENLKKQLFFKN